MLVSGLPVCAAVPTARALIGLLVLSRCWAGGAQLVTELITSVEAIVREELTSALAAEGAAARYLYFDESRALADIVAQSASKSHGRVGAKVWRDGHHPFEWVHSRIAQCADALLSAWSFPDPHNAGGQAADRSSDYDSSSYGARDREALRERTVAAAAAWGKGLGSGWGSRRLAGPARRRRRSPARR